MFDTIFENIFILIPLAVFIGFRILTARRKQQASSNQENAAPVPEAVEETEYIPHWELEKKELPVPKPVAAPAGVSPSGMPLAANFSVDISQAVPRFTPEPGKTITKPPVYIPSPRIPAPGPNRSRIFPKSVENLPALKKALVLSEILGTPKGLQD